MTPTTMTMHDGQSMKTLWLINQMSQKPKQKYGTFSLVALFGEPAGITKLLEEVTSNNPSICQVAQLVREQSERSHLWDVYLKSG